MDNKGGVSARNIGCMIALMTLCSLLMTGLSTSGQDLWISMLIASACTIPLVLIYSRIASLNPGLGLFDVIGKQFGRVGGGILTALLCWFALHVGALVARNFSEFVSTISLENTPLIFIIIGVIAAGGFLAASGDKVMGKWSLVIFIFIFMTITLTLIMALPSMKVSNLKPVMEHSLGEILSEAFSFGAIAFADTLLALVAFGSLKPGEKPRKAYLLGIGWGVALLLIMVLRNIMVLGKEMFVTSVFPSYIEARVINPGSFLEHIESVVSINMILLGITKVSVCVRAASVGIAKLMRNEEAVKNYVAPICLLATAICATSFTNVQQLIAFVEPYRYYALPFTVLIPILLWIKAELGRRKRKRA